MRLLVLVAMVTVGCGPIAWGGVRSYEPLTVPATASRHALLFSAERAVRSLGANQVEVSEAAMRVVAYVEGGGDARDRIVVDVAEGTRIAVAVRTELRVDGKWRSADDVCEEYAHAREAALAERILGAVLPGTAVAWNVD